MAVYALQPRTVDENNTQRSPIKTSFATPFDSNNPDTKMFAAWVDESRSISRDWRAESWRDCEMFDGDQWDQKTRADAIDAGIEPLTINQIFPTLSLIIGSQALNKLDILAKGRTHKDSEISQIMTEGTKYVMDQHNGEFKVSDAFKSQVTSGFGCLAVMYDSDPRKEIVKISSRDWKEIGWDPYSSPWMETSECRYVYHQKWVDLHNLIAMFPGKQLMIERAFSASSSSVTGSQNSIYEDEADHVEWQRSFSGTAGGWIDTPRQRCRPVELWYTVNKAALFLRYPDGSVDELPDSLSLGQQFGMIEQATEVIKAVVKKMRVCFFLGPLVLWESETPFAHDEFPFIPFVGYLDRYERPYGIPRQIRDMQIETNKRRSMALRLLNAHQIIAESDVTDEPNLQKLYEEGQKPDGFLVVNPGSLIKGKIQIVDKAQMAAGQMAIMQQSEMEIQRVSGVNADLLGQTGSASESGRAIEKRTNQGVTITAPLFDNLRRSMKKLGEHIVAGIQQKWTGEKILRITDRTSGAERFVEINKKIQTKAGIYEVKNDITKGRYDIVVSQTPIADTIREKNLELIIEWTKRSAPEMVGPLLMAAMELSGLPNKDKILAQIKPLMGVSPEIDDMTSEELRQYQVRTAKAKQAAAQAIQQMQEQLAQANLAKLVAEIRKVQADTDRVIGNTKLDPLRVEQMSTKIAADHTRTQNDTSRVEIEGFKAGADVQTRNERIAMEKGNRAKDDQHHTVDRFIDSTHQDADREAMTDLEYARLQTELAKSPPAEPAIARANQTAGSRNTERTRM